VAIVMKRATVGVVLVLGFAGCGSKGVQEGKEGGACRSGGDACDDGLTCLSKLCVAAPSNPTSTPTAALDASPKAPSPNGVTPPPTADAFPTAIFVHAESAAIVLACATQAKKFNANATDCAETFGTMPGEVASIGPGPTAIKLGKRHGVLCNSGPSYRGPARDGFTTTDDDAGRFLISPPSRAKDAKLEDTKPTADMALLTKRVTEIFDGTKTRDGKYKLSERGQPIELLGVLQADVDGDGTIESIYSVAAPGDGMYFTPTVILAALSTKAGALTPIYSDTSGVPHARAAIDIDADGRSEILVEARFHVGATFFVGRYDGKALVSSGEWSCGM